MTDGTDLVTVSADEPPHAGLLSELETLGEQQPMAAEGHKHPSPRQYVLIGVILVILTGVEVATSYLEGHVNSNLLIVALALMASVKFFLVAAWYMHMRMDNHFFRRVFVAGIMLATVVYGIVFFFFSSTVLKS